MRKILKVMLTEDGGETLHELAGILRSKNCEISTVAKDGSLIIEKYLTGKISPERKHIEQRMLESNTIIYSGVKKH